MGGGTCTSEGNYKMSEVITKQKILIADDSEMNRELLAAILETPMGHFIRFEPVES